MSSLSVSSSYSGSCCYVSAEGNGCRQTRLAGHWFCSEHEPLFRRWRERWRAGLEVDCRSGGFSRAYANDLVRDGVSSGEWDVVHSELFRLRDAGGAFLWEWVSDALVMRGEFAEAVREKRALIAPGETHTYMSNDILNLCVEGGLPFAAREHIATNALLTALGRTFAAQVERAADEVLIQDAGRFGMAFVSRVARAHPDEKRYGYNLFSCSFCARPKSGLRTFCFYSLPEFYEYCGDLCRRAENLYRSRVGVAEVGGGWVSETALFGLLRNRFGDVTQVLQHHTAEWLGRQHLDIFLPELGIGIEYQGEQHVRGVDYFGGDDAFARTAKRDAAKVMKCRRAGVRLLFVFHDEKLDEAAERLSAEIETRLRGLNGPRAHPSLPTAP